MKTIVIVVYAGAQLLDITGPASVFAEASGIAGNASYQVSLVSSEGGVVKTHGGLGLETRPFSDMTHEAIDTLILPGAHEPSVRALLQDEGMAAWVRVTADRADRLASICSGAFALAAWGLLDGRRATTHWEAAAELKHRFPAISVEEQALFVEDGKVWTSAGVSTGIDMTLALVERDLGREVATKVARRMVLQMRRPGHQSQFSSLLDAQGGEYATLVSWIGDHLSSDLSAEALAERAGQAPRTFHRRFKAQTGVTPANFVERLRLDRARALIEAGVAPTRVVASAGFGSLDQMGRAFRRAFGLSPSAYRTLHKI